MQDKANDKQTTIGAAGWQALYEAAQADAKAAEHEVDRLNTVLIAIQTGYLVNHTSKWVKATVDEALKNA